MWQRFLRAAAGREHDVAMSSDHGRATFAELTATAQHLSRWLARATDPVLVVAALPSGPELMTVQLASHAAGGVFAAIPPTLTGHEAARLFQLITPDVLIVPTAAATTPLLEALPGPSTIVCLEPDATATGLHRRVSGAALWAGELPPPPATRAVDWPAGTRSLQFTSGSTGQPKGVLLSNDNWLADLEMSAEHFSSFAGEAVFSPMPQFHAMGNALPLELLCHGASVHVCNQFMPGEHIRRMRAERCTAIAASPNYYKLLLQFGALTAAAVPGLRALTLGSAAIDRELIAALRQALPAVTMHCRYGLSEAVGALARWSIPPGSVLEHPGLAGRLLPGASIATPLPLPNSDDPGELIVQTPTAGVGQITAGGGIAPLLDANGWLATGDLACVDEHDRLHLRGRRSSFLKHNGYRIHPGEIEEVLRAYPGVQEAMVLGVADPLAGQQIIACVEPLPGETPPTAAELMAFCQSRLSRYKVPQQFLSFEQLPRTRSGKPDRPAVLARVAQ